MKISLRNHQRETLFDARIDPAHPPTILHSPVDPNLQVSLDWDQTLDDSGRLRKCPVCNCRELFVRRDFPQRLGLVVVIATAIVSIVLFSYKQTLAAILVLMGLAVVDMVILFLVGKCVVCYRCRSEYRDLPIGKDQPGWDLATGEKYRPDGDARHED